MQTPITLGVSVELQIGTWTIGYRHIPMDPLLAGTPLVCSSLHASLQL